MLALREECGSLAAYAWRFEPARALAAEAMTLATLLALGPSAEATAMSKDLKRRGWSFVGPTTVYAFMQAMGLVNDHLDGCHARARRGGGGAAGKALTSAPVQSQAAQERAMSNETEAAEDPASHARVDVSDAAAIARWTAALGTTDEALLKAIQVVGPRVDKIKDYLGAGGAAGEQVDA